MPSGEHDHSEYVDGIAQALSETAELRGAVVALQSAVGAHSTQILSAEESAEISTLAARLATAEAKIVVLEGGTPPPDPQPTPDIHEAVNFTLHDAGFYAAAGITGLGRDRTIYRVKAGSSTKPPITGAGTVTPYRIVRCGNVTSTLLAGVVLRDLAIHGYQEQVTHGVTISNANAPVVERVRVPGVKGQGTTPPGETFSLEIHQSANPKLFDVIIDGRNLSGVSVASSLLGFNSVDGGLVEKLIANYAAGFGAALWQSGNYRLVAPDFRFCRRALNLERPYGDIAIEQPDLRNRTSTASAGPDIVVATSGWTPTRGPQAGVRQTSARVVVTEPVWDRTRPITIGVPTLGTNYAAGGNTPHTQRVEDVTVIIDGVPYRGPQNNSLVRIGNYWS